ncbi:hypothetical protein OIU79_015390 [Salix purpurea]|uniref:Uncharacterized protein n=1 Tax=Salix purpurea TaxID=77065 RepID=A0A9Q0PBM8_SALPP|nr:hypothetical protein OIU79_015390 [Salix purpurea]
MVTKILSASEIMKIGERKVGIVAVSWPRSIIAILGYILLDMQLSCECYLRDVYSTCGEKCFWRTESMVASYEEFGVVVAIICQAKWKGDGDIPTSILASSLCYGKFLS